MKVLMVSLECEGKTVSGNGTYASCIRRALISTGHHVVVVCGRSAAVEEGVGQGDAEAEAKEDGIPAMDGVLFVPCSKWGKLDRDSSWEVGQRLEEHSRLPHLGFANRPTSPPHLPLFSYPSSYFSTSTSTSLSPHLCAASLFSGFVLSLSLFLYLSQSLRVWVHAHHSMLGLETISPTKEILP
jgi:hypothetical protein